MKKSKLPPGSKVWIVARHSPGKSQSIHSQLSALLEYCEQNQLTITDKFIDAGEHGYNSNRSEFTRLRRLVEQNDTKQADGVIFYDNSRLARKFKDARYIKAMLSFKGYTYEWLIGEQHEGFAGILYEDIEDYENERAIEVIRQKTRNGLRKMIQLKDESGNYIGLWPGRLPWGYKGVQKVLPVINTVTNKRRTRQCLEPDYDKWPLGRDVFELRSSGLTCLNVEERTGFFASRGRTDFENRNALITAYNAFFSNQIYKGIYIYQELTLENYVEPMVTEELWQAANYMSVTYKRGNWTGYRHPKSGKGDPEFILAGLCECEYCQAPLYPKVQAVSQGRRRYYVCRSKRTGFGHSCQGRYHRAEPFETLVIQHANDNYFASDFIDDIMAEIDNLLNNTRPIEEQVERTQRELSDISKGLRNLARLAQQGITEEITQEYDLLKRQKQEAETKLNRLLKRSVPKKINISRDKVKAALGQLGDRLFQLGEARVVLREIIGKVMVNRQSATVYYRLPVALGEGYPAEILDICHVGYVINLPQVGQLAEI